MVFKGNVNASKTAYILYLARNNKLSTKEITKQCCVLWETVYRIKREDLIEEIETQPKKHAGERPQKLSARRKENNKDTEISEKRKR